MIYATTSVQRIPDHGAFLALTPIWLFASGCPATGTEPRKFAVEVEAGALWQSRNDVAVPGDTGTRFALDEVTGSGPFPVGRVEAVWKMAERHELRGVIAPLTISGDGTLDEDVDFAGESFTAGADTDATFRFDSYRLTYRYMFFQGDEWEWRGGLTAFVRDAEIELEQDGVSAQKQNTGIVPLLYLAGSWRFAPDWRIALDVDAAAASQGRAIDAALKSYWRIGEAWELGFGYRTIEGGADNEEVYTFTWFHQAVVSLRYAFRRFRARAGQARRRSGWTRRAWIRLVPRARAGPRPRVSPGDRTRSCSPSPHSQRHGSRCSSCAPRPLQRRSPCEGLTRERERSRVDRHRCDRARAHAHRGRARTIVVAGANDSVRVMKALA